MMSNNHKPGPTGRFPEGKLAPQDEGEIRFRVGVKDGGTVIIDFGTPVVWVGMPPEKALELARLLVSTAQKAISMRAPLNEGGKEER